MSILLHGDCLEHMKSLDDNSVDFIFCDLPYGQTSCKWDIIVPWQPFWEEIMRIKKLNTPVFFTTTTKFGVQLINSAPKKMPFRWDIVWVKSAPAGFLSAKKMPMRKHEMIYAFYEKLPFYDLSSHKHKFIKTKPREKEDLYGMKGHADGKEGKYDPPLPVSVVKEIDNNNKEEQIYSKEYLEKKTDFKDRKGEPRYEPPLPTSVVKEDIYGFDNRTDDRPSNVRTNAYDPPLPTSVVKEEPKTINTLYQNDIEVPDYVNKRNKKTGMSAYDPPLPTSVVKEEKYSGVIHSGTTGNKTYGQDRKTPLRRATKEEARKWDPPLPTSVVKDQEKMPQCMYGDLPKTGKGTDAHSAQYDPQLPNSILEVKSTRGKHSTEKPVALMEWLLKYFSKEGDVVLDPTMGSGSTGVACKNMNRNFIGIEMDDEIYEVAVNRIEN